MTDAEFFKEEHDCPVYGGAGNPNYCKGCSLGTDGTAVCPFRAAEYESEVK